MFMLQSNTVGGLLSQPRMVLEQRIHSGRTSLHYRQSTTISFEKKSGFLFFFS